MLRRECCKEAPRRLCFNVAVKRRLTRLHSNRVRRVPERCRPFGKVSISVHHTANFCREAQADKNGDGFCEHIGFHRSLLSNPEC